MLLTALSAVRAAAWQGHKHTFGECWLKWQVDPAHPLYGQRGRYSEAFRSKHRMAHMSGVNVDSLLGLQGV